MKTSVLIILAVTMLIVGVLAVMNNACKGGPHAWCAPMSTARSSGVRTHHFEGTSTMPPFDPKQTSVAQPSNLLA
jgi:hypothetical protein